MRYVKKFLALLIALVLTVGPLAPIATALTFSCVPGAGYLSYINDRGRSELLCEDRMGTSNGEVAYCMDFGKREPLVDYGGTFDVGDSVRSVLWWGYPRLSGAYYGITDDQLYYCTQVAIWAVLWQVDIGRIQGDQTLRNMVSYLAQMHPITPPLTLTLPDVNTPEPFGDYWRWGPFSLDMPTGYDCTTEISSGPQGAFMGDAEGNPVSVFSPVSQFYVYADKNVEVQPVTVEIYPKYPGVVCVGWNPPSPITSMQRMAVCYLQPLSAHYRATLQYCSIEIGKTSEDGRVGDREFHVVNESGTFDMIVKTDSNGRAVAKPLAPGTYTVEEINVPERYRQPAAQTVTLSAGENVQHQTLTFDNQLVRGDVDVVKHDKDDPDLYISDTEYKVFHRSGDSGAFGQWELYSTQTTDGEGHAYFKEVPYGEYYVVESRPAYQYLMEKEATEPRYWSVSAEGDQIREDYYNEHEKIACTVNLSTIRRTQEKDLFRYDITNVANTSNTVGDAFFLTDVIDTTKVRLEELYTGVYEGDNDGIMTVLYKTNKSDEWNVWEEEVSTTSQHHLSVSDLSLEEDEYIEAFRYVFGGVAQSFIYTKASSYFVSVLPEITQGDPEQVIAGNVGVEIQRSDMTAVADDSVETRLVDTFAVEFENPSPEKAGRAPRTGDISLLPYVAVVGLSLAAGILCAQKTLARKSKNSHSRKEV